MGSGGCPDVKRAGICLFCRNTKIRASSSSAAAAADGGGPKCSKAAVKALFRYLNLEVTKLFDELTFLDVQDPDELDLMFELIALSMCEACQTVTNDFWEVFLKVERVRLELSNAVEAVGRQMKRLESRNAMTIGDLLNAELDDKLRAEVLEKCNQRINRSPRVSLNDIKEPETSAASSSMSSTSRLSSPPSLSMESTTPTPKRSRSPEQKTPTTPKLLVDQKTSTKSQKEETPEEKVTAKRGRANDDVDDVSPSQEIKQDNAGSSGGGRAKRRRIHSESNNEASDEEESEEEAQYVPRPSTSRQITIITSNNTNASAPAPAKNTDKDRVKTTSADKDRAKTTSADKDRAKTTNANKDRGGFSCDYCDKWFADRRGLTCHVRMHTNAKKNKKASLDCVFCGKLSTTPDDHQIHLLSEHALEVVDELPKGTTQKQLDRAIQFLLNFSEKAHDKKPYQCPLCSIKFDSISARRAHLLEKHVLTLVGMLVEGVEGTGDGDEDDLSGDDMDMESSSDLHECQYCGKVCTNENNLCIHLKTTHPFIFFSNQLDKGTTEEDLELAVNSAVEEIVVVVSKTDSRLKCSICLAMSKQKSFFKPHVLAHHFQLVLSKLPAPGAKKVPSNNNNAKGCSRRKGVVEVDEETLSDSAMNDDSSSEGDETRRDGHMFECSYCGKLTYKNYTNHIHHLMSLHTREYFASQLDSSVTEAELETAVKTLLDKCVIINTGNRKQFSCPVCFKPQHRKSNLRTHLLHKHFDDIVSELEPAGSTTTSGAAGPLNHNGHKNIMKKEQVATSTTSPSNPVGGPMSPPPKPNNNNNTFKIASSFLLRSPSVREEIRLDEDGIPPPPPPPKSPPILIELSDDDDEPIHEQPIDMDDYDTDDDDESRLNIDDPLSSVETETVTAAASPGCSNSGSSPTKNNGDVVVLPCCKLCNKDFSSTAALNKHIKVVHSGRGNFQCQKCFKNYSGRSELRRHEMSAHMMDLFIKTLETKPQLSKTTERQLKWILDKQTRPAEGGKGFQCTHCPQKYPARVHMYLHLNFRHIGEILTDLEIQKAMACDEEEQEDEPDPNGFPRDGDYPHICSLCNRGFNMKCALQRHERTQHMLETFKSQLPPGTQEEELKTAVEVVTKRQHRQTGEADYPFGCPYCERNIRSTADLKIHILNAHFQNVTTQLVAAREGTATQANFLSVLLQ